MRALIFALLAFATGCGGTLPLTGHLGSVRLQDSAAAERAAVVLEGRDCSGAFADGYARQITVALAIEHGLDALGRGRDTPVYNVTTDISAVGYEVCLNVHGRVQ